MDNLRLWRTQKQVHRINSKQYCGSGGGWFPSDPQYARFPQNPETPWYHATIKRGGTGRGTPHSKLPRDNQRPVGRKKTRAYYVCLRAFAAQSRAMGFVNGQRLPRKVRS